jgi:hypothetical protein
MEGLDHICAERKVPPVFLEGSDRDDDHGIGPGHGLEFLRGHLGKPHAVESARGP